MRGIVLLSLGLGLVACKSESSTAPPPPAPPAAAQPVVAAPVNPTPANPAPASAPPGAPAARTVPLELDVEGSTANSVGGVVAATDIQVPAGRYVFTVRADGSQCESADGEKYPILMLTIDGTQVQKWVVKDTKPAEQSSSALSVADGVHHVTVDFINDTYKGPGCDRNARVWHLRIVPEK